MPHAPNRIQTRQHHDLDGARSPTPPGCVVIIIARGETHALFRVFGAVVMRIAWACGSRHALEVGMKRHGRSWRGWNGAGGRVLLRRKVDVRSLFGFQHREYIMRWDHRVHHGRKRLMFMASFKKKGGHPLTHSSTVALLAQNR